MTPPARGWNRTDLSSGRRDQSGACPISARYVKAVRAFAGNDADDLARRTPAPYRFRRSFARGGDRPVVRGDRRPRKNHRRICLSRQKHRASDNGPLRGIAVGIKDIIDTADFPTEMGSKIYKGWRPRADAPVVMMLKAGRGNRRRQDHDHRVRLPRSDRDAQSAQSRSYAGRIVVGLGGSGRGRHDSARTGHADRRFGDPAGFVLRRGRDQAVVPAAADGRREVFFVDAGHGRPVRRGCAKIWRTGLSAITNRPELLPGRGNRATAHWHRDPGFCRRAGPGKRGGACGSRLMRRHAPAPPFARSLCLRHWRKGGAPMRPCRNSRRIRRSLGNTRPDTKPCRRYCAQNSMKQAASRRPITTRRAGLRTAAEKHCQAYSSRSTSF